MIWCVDCVTVSVSSSSVPVVRSLSGSSVLEVGQVLTSPLVHPASFFLFHEKKTRYSCATRIR